MCISMCGYAQDSTQTKEFPLQETIYKDAKHAISQLAEALEVGAEHVYGVLVKQQVVYSIIYLSLGMLGILLLTLAYKQMRMIKGDGRGAMINESIPHLIYSIISGVVGFVLSVIALFNIGNIITGFVNPEYGAIKEIVNMIR